MRRVLLLVAATVALVLVAGRPAFALTAERLDSVSLNNGNQGSGHGKADNASGTITITASSPGSPAAQGPSPAPASQAPAASPPAAGSSAPVSVSAAQAGQASFLLGLCQGLSLGTSTCAGQTPAAPAAPAAPVVSPAQLAVQAESQIRLRAPAVQLSPAVGVRQIVNAPTWAWMDPADFVPLRATAAAGGVVVTATATPVAINLSWSDGGRVNSMSCGGAGTPYSDGLAHQEDPLHPLSAASPTCGWTFRHSSVSAPGGTVPVSATVGYRVSWSVTGAAGGGDLGVLDSPATDYQLTVGQIQVLNTG